MSSPAQSPAPSPTLELPPRSTTSPSNYATTAELIDDPYEDHAFYLAMSQEDYNRQIARRSRPMQMTPELANTIIEDPTIADYWQAAYNSGASIATAEALRMMYPDATGAELSPFFEGFTETPQITEVVEDFIATRAPASSSPEPLPVPP